MDSMGIRRYLGEEGEEAVPSTGRCRWLQACSYTAKKSCSGLALIEAHKTQTCGSRTNARAVWFYSGCYGSCLQFCISFDTIDSGKLKELIETQKMA